MPIEENSKIEDFIDGINHCKEGYQFYYSSSKFKDSIQKKVLFKQPLYNLLNEDALYKDTMYLCPVKIGFDYNVSNTYKSEKTVISQGKVNLNFNCIYINEIQIKYLR